MTDIIRFLERKSGDHQKRMIHEIWAWNDNAWEDEHDFIQWLFPLSEKSMSVPNSPVIRDAEISKVKESVIAQDSLQKSAERYRLFLSREKYWKVSHNHNHLRITRVIKSLRLLSSDNEANDFKHWIASELGDKIDRLDEKTRQFWRLA